MKLKAPAKPPRDHGCTVCGQRHDTIVSVVKQGDAFRAVWRKRIRADRLPVAYRAIYWGYFRSISHVKSFELNGCRYYMDFTETLVCGNMRAFMQSKTASNPRGGYASAVDLV